MSGSGESAFAGGERSAPAVSADHLCKHFGARVAFEDVTFEVGRGEVFGFLGPNGAGKTTTVRVLGTLIAPSSGSATVAGVALEPDNGVEIRRRISLMQGTLEPVLATPVRREELLLGKALAALVPSIGVAYLVFGLFLACVELFAAPSVAPALIRTPDLLAQLLFTPLLAGWSIWTAMLISTWANDVRVAQQLAMVASLPSVALIVLVALGVIPASLFTALVAAAVLLLLNRLGLRLVSATFDRERLIIGTK